MSEFKHIFSQYSNYLDGSESLGCILPNQEFRVVARAAKSGNNDAAHLIYRTYKTYYKYIINTYGRQTLAKYHDYFEDLQTTQFKVINATTYKKLWMICERCTFEVLKNYDLDNPNELPFSFYLGLYIKSRFDFELKSKIHDVMAPLEEIDANKKEINKYPNVDNMLLTQAEKLLLKFCMPNQSNFVLTNNLLGLDIDYACAQAKIPYRAAQEVATYGMDELQKVLKLETRNFPAHFIDLDNARKIAVVNSYRQYNHNMELDEIVDAYESHELEVAPLREALLDLTGRMLTANYDVGETKNSGTSFSLRTMFDKIVNTDDLTERAKLVQRYAYNFGGILSLIDASKIFQPEVKQVFEEDLLLSQQIVEGKAKKYTPEEYKQKIGYIDTLSYFFTQYNEARKKMEEFVNEHGGKKFLSQVFTKGVSDKVKFQINNVILAPITTHQTIEEFHEKYGKYMSSSKTKEFLTEKINTHIEHVQHKKEMVEKMGGIECVFSKFLPRLNEIELQLFFSNKLNAGHVYYLDVMKNLNIDEVTYEQNLQSLKEKITKFQEEQTPSTLGE